MAVQFGFLIVNKRGRAGEVILKAGVVIREEREGAAIEFRGRKLIKPKTVIKRSLDHRVCLKTKHFLVSHGPVSEKLTMRYYNILMKSFFDSFTRHESKF